MAKDLYLVILAAVIASLGLFAITYLKLTTNSKTLSDDFSWSPFTLNDGQTSPYGL